MGRDGGRGLGLKCSERGIAVVEFDMAGHDTHIGGIGPSYSLSRLLDSSVLKVVHNIICLLKLVDHT